MGSRGDPSRCWCQFFRLRGKAWEGATRSSNRAALREQVDLAPPPGVLAYVDDEPVGWCAVGPFDAYPRLAASPSSRAERTDAERAGSWSVTCFVVRVGHRRQGLGSVLLEAAVDLAGTHGAAVVEGYPVDVAARATTSSAELYHGTLSLFVAHGFTEVARPSPGRALVRRRL